MITLDNCLNKTKKLFERHHDSFCIDKIVQESENLETVLRNTLRETEENKKDIETKRKKLRDLKSGILLDQQRLGDTLQKKENIIIKKADNDKKKKETPVDLVFLEKNFKTNQQKILELEKKVSESIAVKEGLCLQKKTCDDIDIDTVVKESKTKEDKLRETTSQIKDISIQISERVEEFREKKLSNKNNKEKIQTIEKNISLCQESVNSSQKQLKDVERNQKHNVEELEKNKRLLKLQENTKNKEKENLSKIESNLKKSKKELAEIYALSEEEISNLKEDVETKRKLINTYSQKLHENELRYMKNLEEEKSKTQQLQLNIKNLQEDLKDNLNEKKAKEDIITCQLSQIQNKKKEIGDLRMEIESRNKNISEDKKIIDTLKKKNAEYEKNKNILESDLEKLNNQIMTKKRKIQESEEEHNKIKLKNKELSDNIIEFEKEVSNLQLKNDVLHEEIVSKKDELRNSNVFIQQYKNMISDLEDCEKNLSSQIKEKDVFIGNIENELESKKKKSLELEKTIEELSEDLKKKKNQINTLKYDLDVVINQGQSTFNEFSVQMKDLIYVIENYIQEKIPEHEVNLIKELENVFNISRSKIDIKMQEGMKDIQELFSEGEKQIISEYDTSLQSLQEKCKKIDMMELQLGNKIKSYEMYDICNVEKNNIINDSFNFVNEKRKQLVAFKTNIQEIERINSKLNNLELNNYLIQISEKCSNIDKFKAKVDSLVNNQNKILKGFFGSSEIKLYDKIQTLENNVFKLIVVLFVQFIGLVLMWIF